jgi:hypothetical protein
MTEAGGALLATMRSRTPQENLSASIHMYGFHRAQLALLDRVLAHGPAPDIRAAHHYGRAVSWAGRGAWDSALVSAARYAREGRAGDVELLPLQLAAIGALVGAVAPDVAGKQLEAASASRDRVTGATAAELAWLEGLGAFVRMDNTALSAARMRLRRMTSSSDAAVLERSLAAFAAAAAGRTAAAGDSLAVLEYEGARAARHFTFAVTHPFFAAANRLLAARWLADAGHLERAEALLFFPDATFPADLRRTADVNLALAPLALLERARIAEARGHVEDARRLYAEALARLDAPAPLVRRLLTDPR